VCSYWGEGHNRKLQGLESIPGCGSAPRTEHIIGRASKNVNAVLVYVTSDFGRLEKDGKYK
jgi:hypothetical protein